MFGLLGCALIISGGLCIYADLLPVAGMLHGLACLMFAVQEF